MKKLLNRLLEFLGWRYPVERVSILPPFPETAPFFAYYTHRAIRGKMYVTSRGEPDTVCAEILAMLKCGCDVRYHHTLHRIPE